MPVRVAEVEAYSAARPRPFIDNGHLMLPEPVAPDRQLGGWDRERQVQPPVPIVGRRGEAGRRALLEQEQHLTGSDVEGDEPLTSVDYLETEQIVVEPSGPARVSDVEGRFENAVDTRHWNLRRGRGIRPNPKWS